MSAVRYLVPNAFTALSLVFGLASVAASQSGEFDAAGWFILWGVLLDKLDGAAARLLKATSEFGVQFDSFADFIVFGTAPAALVYYRLSALPEYSSGSNQVFLIAVTAGYVVATACRLARFNIAEPVGGDRFFFGLPTTLTGALIAASYLSSVLFEHEALFLQYALMIQMVLGISMVSNLRLPKLKMRNNVLVNAFQTINVSIVYVTTPFKMWPHYLLALGLLYILVGVTWAYMNPIEVNESPEPSVG